MSSLLRSKRKPLRKFRSAPRKRRLLAIAFAVSAMSISVAASAELPWSPFSRATHQPSRSLQSARQSDTRENGILKVATAVHLKTQLAVFQAAQKRRAASVDACTITGRVLDTARKPIANSTVKLLSSSEFVSTLPESVQSDENGKFTLVMEVVRGGAGDARLHASAGRLAGALGLQFNNRCAGFNEVSHDITLEPIQRVSGKVTRGGMPAANVNVALFLTSSTSNTRYAELPTQVVTTQDGSFNAEVVGDGLYRVVASMGFVRAEKFLQIVDGFDVAPTTLEIPFGRMVTAEVVDTLNVPVSGAKIESYGDAATPSSFFLTGSDGKAQFEVSNESYLNLSVSKPGYRFTSLVVSSAPTARTTMEKVLRIKGRLITPLDTATSVLLNNAETAPTRIATLSKSGEFAFDVVADYLLRSPGTTPNTLIFHVAGVGDSQPITFTTNSDKEVDLGQITVAAAKRKVAGTFTRPNNVAVANALITVSTLDWSEQLTTKTDASGHFAIDNVPHGRYRIALADANDYITKELDLRSSSVTDIQFIGTDIPAAATEDPAYTEDYADDYVPERGRLPLDLQTSIDDPNRFVVAYPGQSGFPEGVLPGDEIVKINGKNPTYDAVYGPYNKAATMEVFRPATGETIKVKVSYSDVEEEGGC